MEKSYQLNLNTEFIKNEVVNKGYLFLDLEWQFEELLQECLSLNLLEGDHVEYPLNTKIPNQIVKQRHLRSYHLIDDPQIPKASEFCKYLSYIFKIDSWLLNEIGYQVYRDERDWISPHRDRKTDQLLSLTITLSGSAEIKIYQSSVEPPDYQQLNLIDQHLTRPGTLMFLRAAGFGERIIHEVCSPIISPRKILNLRMRKDILKKPDEWLKYFKRGESCGSENF